jgi:hypothetical protein
MISSKMRSPAFPPRRPSAIVRYLVPAIIIITLFYHFSGPQQPQSPSIPPTSYVSPPDSLPKQATGQLGHESPAGKTGASQPSDPSAKLQHEAKKPRPQVPAQEPIGDTKPKEEETLQVDQSKQPSGSGSGSNSESQSSGAGAHPIDRLIDLANKQFDDQLTEESHTLSEAAAAYRKRRGRHPPPGFDQWYAFATERNAVMVESFWDQIYHDLEPFWALPALEIRKGAWDYEMTINVREGIASAKSDWFWTQIWLNLIKTIEHLLPDMDIALNAMDEPRMVVPWEDMNAYMNKASATRGMVPAKDAINEFEHLKAPGEGPDRAVKLPEKNWEGTSK